MSATSGVDFASLAGTDDFELASLSEEQFQALWATELMEVDPDCAAVMVVGLRALIAAGLAEATSEGDIRLRGAAAVIREVLTQSLPALVVQTVDASSERRPRTWLVAAPGFILEQQWSPVGVHQFTLRRLTRAVRELVDDLIPAGPAAAGEKWTWSQSDAVAGDQLKSLFEANQQVTQIAVAVPITNLAGPAATWIESAWFYANDGVTPGWVLTTRPDGSAEAMRTDRGQARAMLLAALTGDQPASGAYSMRQS